MFCKTVKWLHSAHKAWHIAPRILQKVTSTARVAISSPPLPLPPLILLLVLVAFRDVQCNVRVIEPQETGNIGNECTRVAASTSQTRKTLKTSSKALTKINYKLKWLMHFTSRCVTFHTLKHHC